MNNIFIGLGIFCLFVLILIGIGLIVYNIDNIKIYFNQIFKEYIQNFSEIIINNENKHENKHDNKLQKQLLDEIQNLTNKIQNLTNKIQNIFDKLLSLVTILFLLYILKDVIFYIIGKFDKLLKR